MLRMIPLFLLATPLAAHPVSGQHLHVHAEGPSAVAIAAALVITAAGLALVRARR